ncbi:polysaccharide deacetylase family protein [Undibacterium sp. TS12]|uniref:polysaccharide deacetylase family protein n=1 Tax=Undibacterium sp. TS12 TaxID=2908202 RepID=UPI001F4CF6DA|nr:polysaccharide deacetylase family protein [Undibacterium sp. TS12]MCH8618604.1 polysaccharide deacetylase family protein [Undibacterium sp. TS12]
MSLAQRLSRFAARHIGCRWLPLNKARGVVSFSFDDVPASACHQGAMLLERYQARGTFYVCGGLTDGIEQNQVCHSAEDLQRLQENGHEVGCHTYSHTNCANASNDMLTADWEKNQAFFKQHNIADCGFAFPFGAYDLGSKLAANKRFSYNRITGGGTQIGRADLSALRAQSLYSGRTNMDALVALIAHTASQGGWLILYSHEVSETPGPWGTTPELLETALQLATQEGCQVLPVHRAIDFFLAPL